MEIKNCYRELPEGYEKVKEVDAIKDKKFAVLINVVGGFLMIAVGALLWFLRITLQGEDPLWFFMLPLDIEPVWRAELLLVVFILCLCVYLVLHELTHGVVYKILTHEKLTFGISLSCAFCGVPGVYVNRKTALFSLLTPFTLFSLLLLPIVFLTDGWIAALALLLFSSHFGGCAGDLFVTWLFLTSLRGDVLMNDTGPKQTFYVRKNNIL